MQATYIFGHRNPDTDSVCSSIALSYLKNKLGEKTIPRVIGHLNNETKFVLNYFHVVEPQYLNDVRIRIRNLKYNKKGMVFENDSIFKALKAMQEQNVSGISIINKQKKLTGFTSLKDLTRYLVNGNHDKINTNLDNLNNVLFANTVLKSNTEFKGNLVIFGVDKIKINENTILVVDKELNEEVLKNRVKLIILTKNGKINRNNMELAKENAITIIKSCLSLAQIFSKIAMVNYITTVISSANPVFVYDDDYYTEFQVTRNKYNYTNYPVINHKNDCLGIISLSWPNEYVKQNVILVDHNNIDQSVIGIEEANIVEIIDHHNLGSIGLSKPINFRSKPVGCTATIIYESFIENGVSIPKAIAGLLLSAVLSDTLLLTSPTTTEEDKTCANKLAKIAKIDIHKYGYEMIKASSSIKGLSINEQIYQDYKSYNVGNRQMGIGQLVTLDFDKILNNVEDYVAKLEELHFGNNGVYVLFVTDVMKNGSYVIYNKDSELILKEAFNLEEIYQGVFIKGIISRKKQIIPPIMSILV